MAKLSYFDCNCSIGRVPCPYLYDISDAAGLEREMAAAGIEEAPVYHALARDCDPPIGNSLLEEAIRGIKGLYPVWVVLPHNTEEMPPPARLLKDMASSGVRAVRMYPSKDFHSFSLAEWNVGELLAALEESRIPLMLDIEIVGWESIVAIMQNHPRLPLIATNVSYRHNRFTYPLFDRFPNLYVETSRYFGAGIYEDIVRLFGSRPLLFGTNMPRFTGTAAISMLTYADIPEKDKEAIAGGNLRNLLRGAFL